MSLRYFSIDRIGAPRAPPNVSLHHAKSFGLPLLDRKQTLQDKDGNTVHVNEREQYLKLLWDQTSGFTKGGPFHPNVCVYVFGISANTWMKFEGQFRLALKAANHKGMPHIIADGEEAFELSPRKPKTKWLVQIIRSTFEQEREDDFDWRWLSVDDFKSEGSLRNIWYEGLWKHLFVEQGKLLSDHITDIKKNGKGRVDQLVTFDWSRSSLGEVCSIEICHLISKY